ncbi:MAG: heavy metal translocating P-type ATPase, partial [Nostoc sp.]
GCSHCEHDHHENHNHDHDENHNHDHNHEHGGEFNLKNEIFPLVMILSLYAPGVIFENQLHNTFYSIGEYLLFIPAYLLSGWSVLKTAGRNILRGRVFDETFLMAVATLGAIAIHKLPEAVGVMLFYK